MPPRKQPKTLQELSLKRVASLTMEYCVNIERKHGGWKCQASRDELKIWKIYLSSIRPLADDLWKEVFDMYFTRYRWKSSKPYKVCEEVLNCKILVLELLICDKLRTVNLGHLHLSNKCFANSIFWNNQLLKLKNVVELDTSYVRLTDESFQTIGDVCTNVKKLNIAFNSYCASKESLKHILKCRELRELTIDFKFFFDNINEYVGMLATGLPKLEYFHDWLKWDMDGAMSMTKPLPSMRKLNGNMYSAGLAQIIRVCPNLTDLDLVFGSKYEATSDSHETDKVLKVLAESSLQLKTLKLNQIASIKELACLISSNGKHLTSLHLKICKGKGISVNDVYTIGVCCPGLVELRITEYLFSVEERRLFNLSNGPNMEEQTFVTTPPMFVCLKVLELRSNIDWDQRILPLILSHADNLTRIRLEDVFKPSNNIIDPLSPILNAVALQELKSIIIGSSRYHLAPCKTRLPITSIDRLLDCCHKLTNLLVTCDMEDETIDYLKKLQSCMESENFDLAIRFNMW